MRRIFHLIIAGLVVLTACNTAKKPNNVNLTSAINEYLKKHGEVCTVIGRQFPIDLPRSEQGEQYGIGPKLAALEQAGVVRAGETTAVVHSMLDPLRGPERAQPVKRYELSESGKKYFQQIPGTLGQTSGFCYGEKSVEAILRWTEPISSETSSQIEVTYSYKIVDAAGWAERPDVQQAFSDIRTTMTGASKTPEVVGLQLSDKGWEVPGQ